MSVMSYRRECSLLRRRCSSPKRIVIQRDYYGATNAGLRAVLLQRESGDRVPCSDDNVLRIKSLQELFLLDYFN